MRLGTRLPTTTEEAQFNQAWPLAAMLVDGEIGPAQMLEMRLSDPQIRMLAAKVGVVEDEEMERLCQLFEQGDPTGRFASSVTITLHDGREFYSGVVDGDLRFPQPGWDEARMEREVSLGSRVCVGSVVHRHADGDAVAFRGCPKRARIV